MRVIPIGFGERYSGILSLGMALLMATSVFIMRSDRATVAGQKPSLHRAIFIVANAATLSGFELTTSVSEYKITGQITIFALIVAGTFVSLLVGGWALLRILNMPYTDGQVVQATVFMFLLAMLIGAAALLGPTNPDQPAMTLWPALFQAASAFGNAGHIIGPTLAWNDSKTYFVLLPLAFVGGLGIPVILDVTSSITLRHRLHSHTRSVLVMTAAIYLIGTITIMLTQFIGSDQFDKLQESGPYDVDELTHAHSLRAGLKQELQGDVVLGSTESLNSRTLGMPLGSFTSLLPAGQWIVLLLMFIGGSPASTAGGLKNTTLLVLMRDSWQLWRGQVVSRLFGLATLWLIIYLAAILITTVLLAIANPQMPAERMLFLSVSAVSNTGTSHVPLSQPTMGSYALTSAMLFGRFAPLAILWWAARDTIDGKG